MNKHSEMAAPRLESRHDETRRFADWKLALKSILGFWLFYALTVVARAYLGADPLTALQNKAWTIGAGILLTTGIYVAIRLFAARATLRRQAMIAAAASFIAAAGQAGILIAADRYLERPQDEHRFVSREG